jgi:hypothetical protein
VLDEANISTAAKTVTPSEQWHILHSYRLESSASHTPLFSTLSVTLWKERLTFRNCNGKVSGSLHHTKNGVFFRTVTRGLTRIKALLACTGILRAQSSWESRQCQRDNRTSQKFLQLEQRGNNFINNSVTNNLSNSGLLLWREECKLREPEGPNRIVLSNADTCEGRQ